MDDSEKNIVNRPLVEQAAYWQKRARFFEGLAYDNLKAVQRLEAKEDGEGWKDDYGGWDDANWWKNP